jgi:hypothetical protein
MSFQEVLMPLKVPKLFNVKQRLRELYVINDPSDLQGMITSYYNQTMSEAEMIKVRDYGYKIGMVEGIKQGGELGIKQTYEQASQLVKDLAKSHDLTLQYYKEEMDDKEAIAEAMLLKKDREIRDSKRIKFVNNKNKKRYYATSTAEVLKQLNSEFGYGPPLDSDLKKFSTLFTNITINTKVEKKITDSKGEEHFFYFKERWPYNDKTGEAYYVVTKNKKRNVNDVIKGRKILP